MADVLEALEAIHNIDRTFAADHNLTRNRRECVTICVLRDIINRHGSERIFSKMELRAVRVRDTSAKERRARSRRRGIIGLNADDFDEFARRILRLDVEVVSFSRNRCEMHDIRRVSDILASTQVKIYLALASCCRARNDHLARKVDERGDVALERMSITFHRDGEICAIEKRGDLILTFWKLVAWEAVDRHIDDAGIRRKLFSDRGRIESVNLRLDLIERLLDGREIEINIVNLGLNLTCAVFNLLIFRESYSSHFFSLSSNYLVFRDDDVDSAFFPLLEVWARLDLVYYSLPKSLSGEQCGLCVVRQQHGRSLVAKLVARYASIRVQHGRELRRGSNGFLRLYSHSQRVVCFLFRPSSCIKCHIGLSACIRRQVSYARDMAKLFGKLLADSLRVRRLASILLREGCGDQWNI